MSAFEEFGVVLPNLALFGGEPAGHSELLSYARAAEGLGFRSAWAADHIMHETASHYAPACLQAVATALPRMKIGFGTMPAFVRHPLVAAKVIFTLQALSEGRLEVALSIGDERNEMRALGVNPAERGRRLDELLEILTLLAAGGGVTYEGPSTGFQNVHILPGPANGKLPPMFIASWTGDKSLTRILKYGTGWMASGLFSSEKRVRDGMVALRDGATAAGVGEPPAMLTNVLLFITDREAEIESRRAFLGGPQPIACPPGGLRLVGPVGFVREQLALIQDIGFRRLNVLPVDYEARQLEAFMKIAS